MRRQKQRASVATISADDLIERARSSGSYRRGLVEDQQAGRCMKAWISLTFCLLRWEGLAEPARGVEIEASDKDVEIRAIDAAAKVGERGQNVAACEVGISASSTWSTPPCA